MSNLHIYAAKGQPATRYVLEVDTPKGVKRLISRTPARSLLPCHKCRKRRIAKNLVAHVYYDGTWFYCRVGKGCRA